MLEPSIHLDFNDLSLHVFLHASLHVRCVRHVMVLRVKGRMRGRRGMLLFRFRGRETYVSDGSVPMSKTCPDIATHLYIHQLAK
jgi:hypothetical protein